MRTQLVTELLALARKDKNVMLLTGDVGFSYLEEFQEELPKQFINCGIAEQNMIGVATGLALAGKKPWVYTMVNFVLFRPYEQVRTACYHNANINLIGIGGGGAYDFIGFTHNIVPDEDLSVLEKLPNIEVHIPKTAEDVETFVKQMNEQDGPAYIRL